MQPGFFEEVQRRHAEHKRRILAGELLVCKQGSPMPEGGNLTGKWFHQDAQFKSKLPDSTKEEAHLMYKCPVCTLEFEVFARKLEIPKC